jgi:hypothetical protein
VGVDGLEVACRVDSCAALMRKRCRLTQLRMCSIRTSTAGDAEKLSGLTRPRNSTHLSPSTDLQWVSQSETGTERQTQYYYRGVAARSEQHTQPRRYAEKQHPQTPTHMYKQTTITLSLPAYSTVASLTRHSAHSHSCVSQKGGKEEEAKHTLTHSLTQQQQHTTKHLLLNNVTQVQPGHAFLIEYMGRRRMKWLRRFRELEDVVFPGFARAAVRCQHVLAAGGRAELRLYTGEQLFGVTITKATLSGAGRSA